MALNQERKSLRKEVTLLAKRIVAAPKCSRLRESLSEEKLRLDRRLSDLKKGKNKKVKTAHLPGLPQCPLCDSSSISRTTSGVGVPVDTKVTISCDECGLEISRSGRASSYKLKAKVTKAWALRPVIISEG